MKIKCFTLLLLALCITTSQSQTLGLLSHQEGTAGGYSLFTKSGVTHLIDTGGQLVHTWDHGNNSNHPGYLQANGDLIVVSRGVKRYSWDGLLLWEYINSAAHHDVDVLPNGNVLLLINEFFSYQTVIDAGRDPDLLDGGMESMLVIEINDAGEIIWQWRAWDHLIQDFDPAKANYGVVEDHPERIDLNYIRNSGADWLHPNAIDYNPELDQIVLSPRFFNEVWVIDHSTTTAEAADSNGGLADMGGDLLYRWGNPAAYRAGDANEQMNFGSHDVQWIEPGKPGAGNLMIYNNGGVRFGRDGNYSTVDEFIPPLNGFQYTMTNGRFGPEELTWQYQAPVAEDFYSSFISGAHRLENGNTFINEGEDGHLFEVTVEGHVVWQYQSPITNNAIYFQGDMAPAAPDASLFRSYRYPTNYPAFEGKELIPLGPVELYNSVNVLTLSSIQANLLIYPAVGEQILGENQLIPLMAKTDGAYRFVEWVVQSGKVQIEDVFSPHTQMIKGDGDVDIEAVFEINPDWIFGDGFE